MAERNRCELRPPVAQRQPEPAPAPGRPPGPLPPHPLRGRRRRPRPRASSRSATFLEVDFDPAMVSEEARFSQFPEHKGHDPARQHLPPIGGDSVGRYADVFDRADPRPRSTPSPATPCPSSATSEEPQMLTATQELWGYRALVHEPHQPPAQVPVQAELLRQPLVDDQPGGDDRRSTRWSSASS